MQSIYLAGPIAGASYNGANDWRELVRQALPPTVLVLSPLRDIKPLATDLSAPVVARYEATALTTGKAITARDRFDVQRADVVLVNLLGAGRVSIGTMIELGWADMLRKPIVLVMEPTGNLHEHEMVREVCSVAVGTLEEGIAVVKSILGRVM